MKKFDIFISHKHMDTNGNLTEDYYIAKNLYDVLVGRGYSVFLSSSSLEELGSSRYKADIDNALDSAKLMIVVLTQEDYALSQWVQYEWDSFYNDYLSGNRNSANLYTLTKDVNIHNLPRTLRNVQNFVYDDNYELVCSYVENALPINTTLISEHQESSREQKFILITGKQITPKEIQEVLDIEDGIYSDNVQVTLDRCLTLHKINPNVYFMVKDVQTNKIIGCMDIEPIDDDFYERLKQGHIIDMDITPDVVLGYNMPYPYSIYFSSVIIHPDYKNTEVFFMLYNAVIKQFLDLAKREIFIKRMIADAVTLEGEKFSKLFGMVRVNKSDHGSTLYEVSMIPPKFRILSKSTKELYDCYRQKYEEAPYLFERDD